MYPISLAVTVLYFCLSVCFYDVSKIIITGPTVTIDFGNGLLLSSNKPWLESVAMSYGVTMG